MVVKEIALAFQCEKATLIGVLHLPENPQKIGLLTLVAGGPQYRAGVCRQLVTLGRELASSGVAVMRFDHRGIGDSVDDFRGFEYVEKDIEAAIETFREQVPGLDAIALWGGCDAASGVMINAWRYPEVTSLILGNPFVSSAETEAAVTRQHYLARLKQREFWMKLLTFKYNPFDYLVETLHARKAMREHRSQSVSVGTSEQQNQSFQSRMLEGLEKFRGDVLFLMSGRSLVSKEFDELVQRDPRWQKRLNEVPYKRVDLPEADQAFSTEKARNQIIAEARSWLLEKT